MKDEEIIYQGYALGENHRKNLRKEFLAGETFLSRPDVYSIMYSEKERREKVVHALKEYGLDGPVALNIIERDNVAIVGYVAASLGVHELDSLGKLVKFQQPYDIFKPLKLYTTFLADDFQKLLTKAGYTHRRLRGKLDCKTCNEFDLTPSTNKTKCVATLSENEYGHAHPPNLPCSEIMREDSPFITQLAKRVANPHTSDGLPDLPYKSEVRMYESEGRYIEIVMLNIPQALKCVIKERAYAEDMQIWLCGKKLESMSVCEDSNPFDNEVEFYYNTSAVTTHCIGVQRMLEMRHRWHTRDEKLHKEMMARGAPKLGYQGDPTKFFASWKQQPFDASWSHNLR